MWYVYILRCSNGQLYKGCTNNLDERLKLHKSGQVDSTKALLPLQLVSYTVFFDKNKAYQFEKYLKSGSGRAFLNKHLA